MKTELLAESIFSLVIHGMGTKAQIVSAISDEIEKHHEPVSNSYKSIDGSAEDVEIIKSALETLRHAASCGYSMSLNRSFELAAEAITALDRLTGKLLGTA